MRNVVRLRTTENEARESLKARFTRGVGLISDWIMYRIVKSMVFYWEIKGYLTLSRQKQIDKGCLGGCHEKIQCSSS